MAILRQSTKFYFTLLYFKYTLQYKNQESGCMNETAICVLILFNPSKISHLNNLCCTSHSWMTAHCWELKETSPRELFQQWRSTGTHCINEKCIPIGHSLLDSGLSTSDGPWWWVSWKLQSNTTLDLQHLCGAEAWPPQSSNHQPRRRLMSENIFKDRHENSALL